MHANVTTTQRLPFSTRDFEPEVSLLVFGCFGEVSSPTAHVSLFIFLLNIPFAYISIDIPIPGYASTKPTPHTHTSILLQRASNLPGPWLPLPWLSGKAIHPVLPLYLEPGIPPGTLLGS